MHWNFEVSMYCLVRTRQFLLCVDVFSQLSHFFQVYRDMVFYDEFLEF